MHLRRCTSYVSLPFPALVDIHECSEEVDQDPLHIWCFGGAEHGQAIIRYTLPNYMMHISRSIASKRLISLPPKDPNSSPFSFLITLCKKYDESSSFDFSLIVIYILNNLSFYITVILASRKGKC